MRRLLSFEPDDGERNWQSERAGGAGPATERETDMPQNTSSTGRRTTAAHNARTTGIVTHTTVLVAGPQQATITATSAATDEAQMIVALGHVMMTFRSAETVSAVITGFATVRAALAGADGQAPHPAQPGAEFGAAAISVLWLDSPEHTAVPHHRYSSEQRRTIHWVDLHMGPVTWRITDRIGYDTLMAELRRVHRAAVGVFLDGSRYRRDPAKLLDVFDDV